MRDAVKAFRLRRLRRLKSRFDEEDWVTIKGTHVLIDEEGNVTGGPDNIKKTQFKRAQPSARTKRQEQTQSTPKVAREKVSTEPPVFMEPFLSRKRNVKTWNRMQEYVNNKEDADPTCANVFSAISKMHPDIMNGGKLSSLGYAEPDSATGLAGFSWAEGFGVPFAPQLKLYDPNKYDSEDVILTNIHEMSHMADHYTFEEGKGLSSNVFSNKLKLPDGQEFFDRENHGVPKEVLDVAAKKKAYFKEEEDKFRTTIASEKERILKKYDGQKTNECVDEINSSIDKHYKEYVRNVRYNWSKDNVGWGELMDIYDALSGGRLMDGRKGHEGLFVSGHGINYFSYCNNARDNRCTEILANYVGIGVCKPELLSILRKDQPELCKELDSIANEMIRRLRG